MRIKISFSVPIPSFGIPKLIRAARKGFRRQRDLDATPRSLAERPLCVEAADRVEYEVPLHSPMADRKKLVREAIAQFLERNNIDCPVGVVMSGESTLLRSVKLPPIETTKIAALAEYEATQQIPFHLNEVQWRWLELGCESWMENFTVGSECLLVAAKSEHVSKFLSPFSQFGLGRKIDLVQTSQLTLGDYLWNFYLLPHGDLALDAKDDSPFVIGLDMGTFSTTLVITSGQSLWSRTIPIGGYHFTQVLAKEHKLSQSKAEELKRYFRHPYDSEMSVLEWIIEDLRKDIQVSINFYKLDHTDTEFAGVAFFGGGFKLPGLKEKVLDAIGLEELKVPFAEGLMPESSDSGDLLYEHYTSMTNALTVAMQRLGVGKFRVNLYPDGDSFGTKSHSAWGIEIGQCALTAVRVSDRQS